MGAQQQRLPRQRRTALSRCGLASRVRHPGVRLPLRPGGARPGRRDGSGPAGLLCPGAPQRRRHTRRDLPVQEQHRLGRQLLRLPRELPHHPARGTRGVQRGAHPVPREPPDLRRRRQDAANRPGCPLLPQPAGRTHLGGGLQCDHPLPAHHQHPRRTARQRRTVPPAARHRGGFQHERVRHVPQGRGMQHPAADAGGTVGGAAGHDPREPHQGDQGDQPRPNLPAAGTARQRPAAERSGHPAGVLRTRPGFLHPVRSWAWGRNAPCRCGSTASTASRRTR